MDILDALADEVTLREFFTEWVPELFEKRREDFARAADIPIILCFKFQDTHDVYSVELAHDGATVEDDEMIDFPVATLLGWAKFWDVVKEQGRPLAEALENRRAEVREQFHFTREFYDDWEAFDVVIDVAITGDPGEDPVTFSLVLNDYDVSDRHRRFGFSIPLSTLDDLAHGRRTAVEVAKDLTIEGDYRIAATLGGMIVSHM